LGDPVFRGLYGQKYQVHGIDGVVYTIVSDIYAHMNALFTFLSSGDCPTVVMTSKTCWTHPGSYIGAVSYQSRDGHRLLVRSGAANIGFSQISLDGTNLPVGVVVDTTGVGSVADNVIVDGIRVDYNSSHIIRVTAGDFDYVIENSDHFLNLITVRVRDWTALTTRIKSHGLLGQTWHKRKGKAGEKAKDVKPIAGDYDDYANADNDLFGLENMYCRFESR